MRFKLIVVFSVFLSTYLLKDVKCSAVEYTVVSNGRASQANGVAAGLGGALAGMFAKLSKTLDKLGDKKPPQPLKPPGPPKPPQPPKSPEPPKPPGPKEPPGPPKPSNKRKSPKRPKSKNVSGQRKGKDGKWFYHNINKGSRKEAYEAAKRAGKGNEPIEDRTPARGLPHFHPTNRDGSKKVDGTHYTYPKRFVKVVPKTFKEPKNER